MSVNREGLLDEVQNRLEKFNDNLRTNEPEAAAQEPARRNGALLRRPNLVEGEGPTNSLNLLIQRVSGESLGESDRLLGELAKVRDMLQVERDRVMRELADYAALNQSAMIAMKAISDNLTQYHRTGKLEARRA